MITELAKTSLVDDIVEELIIEGGDQEPSILAGGDGATLIGGDSNNLGGGDS